MAHRYTMQVPYNLHDFIAAMEEHLSNRDRAIHVPWIRDKVFSYCLLLVLTPATLDIKGACQRGAWWLTLRSVTCHIIVEWYKALDRSETSLVRPFALDMKPIEWRHLAFRHITYMVLRIPWFRRRQQHIVFGMIYTFAFRPECMNCSPIHPPMSCRPTNTDPRSSIKARSR